MLLMMVDAMDVFVGFVFLYATFFFFFFFFFSSSSVYAGLPARHHPNFFFFFFFFFSPLLGALRRGYHRPRLPKVGDFEFPTGVDE